MRPSRPSATSLRRISGGRKVLLAVRRSGEVIGELALLGDRPRMASASARVDSALLTIHQDQLEQLLSHSPTAAEAMFYSILARWRNTDSQLRQSDKMAQLGTLTAGVAYVVTVVRQDGVTGGNATFTP